MIEALAAACVLAIGLPFVAYPALLFLRATFFARPIEGAGIEPSVSLLIAAHDEAASIAARLENALSLDYPADRLEILVASDGSTDETVEIARRFESRGVRVLDLPRGGKAVALATMAAASTSEVLAFTDANSDWRRDALRELVWPLGDPSVGGVAGDQRYVDAATGTDDALGEKGYWSFDRLLKSWQSRAGNAISATGAIYAIRRELFEAPPTDATDDFMISTGVIARGRRLVFAEEAVAFEPPSTTASGEYRRKVRIITRGLRAVAYRRGLMNPMRTGLYGLELAIHKLLRRLVFMPLVGLVLLAPFAIAHGGWVAPLSGGALAGVLLGIVGQALPALRSFRLVSVARYVVLVNAACAAASLNALRGHRVALWDTERAPAGSPESAR